MRVSLTTKIQRRDSFIKTRLILEFLHPKLQSNFRRREISMTTEEVAKSTPFLEITCTSSGKVRRFAVGTEAGFAVQLINRRLGSGVPHASYIEAIKEGQEPISFGHNSILANYGDGWKLQTVTDEGFEKEKHLQATYKKIPIVMRPDGLHPIKGSTNKSKPTESQPRINFQYIGKILLVFILMFMLAGIFTFALENLPRLIPFINSSVKDIITWRLQLLLVAHIVREALVNSFKWIRSHDEQVSPSSSPQNAYHCE